MRYTLWKVPDLWRNCRNDRHQEEQKHHVQPGRWWRCGAQPHRHHHPLSPGRWCKRQPDRLRQWHPNQNILAPTRRGGHICFLHTHTRNSPVKRRNKTHEELARLFQSSGVTCKKARANQGASFAHSAHSVIRQNKFGKMNARNQFLERNHCIKR